MDVYSRLLVHAAAVIAGMAFDVHLDGGIKTHGDGVAALGVDHLPDGLVGVLGLRM